MQKDDELIIVGKVVKSQGNKGEIQVKPLTDDPRRFDRLRQIYLLQAGMAPRLYDIEQVRYQPPERVILKLGGCDSREKAQALARTELAITKKDLVTLPEGSYFHFQIIGLQAFTSEGQYLGRVEQIFPTGSNDVYVIRNGPEECLVPAIKQVVRQVDLDNKKLILKLPEGLI